MLSDCEHKTLSGMAHRAVSNGGILSGLAGATQSGYLQQTQNRLPIPEDVTHKLFQTVFEDLASASPEDRSKVVSMLILVFDL